MATIAKRGIGLGFQANREYSMEKGETAYKRDAITADFTSKNLFMKKYSTTTAEELRTATIKAGAMGEWEII